jgi:hypothetical protein
MTIYTITSALLTTYENSEESEPFIARCEHIKHNATSARNCHCAKKWNPALEEQILDAFVTPH